LLLLLLRLYYLLLRTRRNVRADALPAGRRPARATR
jgi:hypothetical protein